jgi:hypothetical protein
MDCYTIIRAIILSVTIASIFVISVATLSKVIIRAAFFSEKTSVIVAVSLSILLLVPLILILVVPAGPYEAAGSDSGINDIIRCIILSGVALGVAGAVLLSQVMLLASKIPPVEKNDPPTKKSESTVKSKTYGQSRKAKAAEGQTQKTTKHQSETSKKELAPIIAGSNEICRLRRFPVEAFRSGMELQCQ